MPRATFLTDTLAGRGSDILNSRKARGPARWSAVLCVPLALALCSGPPPSVAVPRTSRITLFPKVHPGQSITYLVRYRSEKNVKTESRVVTPSGPENAQTDAQWILQIEILDVRPEGQRAVIRARSQFRSVDSGAASKNPGGEPVAGENATTSAKPVTFTILPDGQALAVSGLDTLFPEQRQAWQEWLRQFAVAGVFPRSGVKMGQVWKTRELEQTPSPITRLQWDKVATYVRDEPCSAASREPEGAATVLKSLQPETCAVILTSAVLKQKSSPKDTTPGDFKLHALRTSGNANGTNETISYISLRTGLVVRVTEEAKQFMDVIIGKADGSNQVHYNVDAQSHTEVLLIDPVGSSKP